MSSTLPHERHVEIDLLRTFAIAAMALYHLVYDLAAFYGWNVDPEHGGWWLLARATATLFLLLVGISFSVSWHRHLSRHGQAWSPATDLQRGWKKYLRRGAVVFGCGLLVSAATYVADPQTYVRFGILHLIGISMLLLPLFAPLREGNALLGIAVIASGLAIPGTAVHTSLLLPFGWMPADFTTVDYFPLLPWFGVPLIGVAIGHFLYVRPGPPRLPRLRVPSWVTWPGRHALLLYLVHQPVLLLLLWLMLEKPAI